MKSNSYVIWDTSAFSGKNDSLNGSFVLHMSIFLCFFFFLKLFGNHLVGGKTLFCACCLWLFFTYSTKQMGTNFVLLQQVTSSKVPKDTI